MPEKYSVVIQLYYSADMSILEKGEPEEGGSITYYECLQVVGQNYKGTYNSNTLFGVHIPEKLLSTNEDMKEADHENINQVDGATLSIEVTLFTEKDSWQDGSNSLANYLFWKNFIYDFFFCSLY